LPIAWHADRIVAAGVGVARFRCGSDEPGAPVLVLLHGLGHWTSAAWDTLVPLLDPAWRIVAFDLPGFGASARPDVAYDLPFFRAVLDDVVRQSAPGRVALVGNSLGGMIAADFAGEQSERVSHLALISPAGFLNVPGLVVRVLGSTPVRWFFMQRPSRAFVERTLRQSLFDPAHLDPAIAARAYELAQDTDLRRAFARIYSGAIQEMRDLPALHARFARYRGPVLLAWGRHDRYIPIRALENARRVYPQAAVEILERSGHISMVEEPGQLAEALRKLIAT